MQMLFYYWNAVQNFLESMYFTNEVTGVCHFTFYINNLLYFMLGLWGDKAVVF